MKEIGKDKGLIVIAKRLKTKEVEDKTITFNEYCLMDVGTLRYSWFNPKSSSVTEEQILQIEKFYKDTKDSDKKVAVFVDLENCYIGTVGSINLKDCGKASLVWYPMRLIKDKQLKIMGYESSNNYSYDKLFKATKGINAKTKGLVVNKELQTVKFSDITYKDELAKDELTSGLNGSNGSNGSNGVVLDMNDERLEDIKENSLIENITEDTKEEPKLMNDQKDEPVENEEKCNTKNKEISQEDLYINIIKLMRKGNKLSVPKVILKNIEKGPVYPVLYDFNTDRKIGLQDFYFRDDSDVKKMTFCVASASDSGFVEIEVVYGVGDPVLRADYKEQFKRDYLKWYKEHLHVRV